MAVTIFHLRGGCLPDSCKRSATYLKGLNQLRTKMKTLALYSLAAVMYVTGGVLMKYSQGLTQAVPAFGLTALFSAGALIQARAMRHEELGTSYIVVLGLEALLAIAYGSLLFGEQISLRAAAGIALVMIGIVILRLS
jgi:multidrug transporter EmrE-like cation transporter